MRNLLNKFKKIKMNFIFFSQSCLPHVGGIENYVDNFTKELQKKGHKVLIVTATLNKSFTENKADIITISLHCISIFNGRFLIPISIFNIFNLIHKIFEIKKNSKTIIINQTRFFPIPILGAILAFFLNIHCVTIDHSSNYLPSKNKVLRKIFIAYENTTAFLLKKLNVEFASVSKSSANWLKNFGINTNFIISNGISIKELKTSNKILKIYRIIDGKTILFASGRLIKEKGFLEIINAFNKFSIKHKEYILLIAGEGELEEEIAGLINKNTLFLGKLRNEEIMSLLKKCDLYIFASVYPEGLPTVLLEAGITSVPIMSTLAGGSKEIIGNGKRGIILNNGSANEIEEKLIWFNSHRTNARLMGINLKKFIIKNYDWKKIVKNFLKKYE